MWVFPAHSLGIDTEERPYTIPEREKRALESKYEMPESDTYKRDIGPTIQKPWDMSKEEIEEKVEELLKEGRIKRVKDNRGEVK